MIQNPDLFAAVARHSPDTRVLGHPDCVVEELAIHGLHAAVAAVSGYLPGPAAAHQRFPDLKPARTVRSEIHPLPIMRPCRTVVGSGACGQAPWCAALR